MASKPKLLPHKPDIEEPEREASIVPLDGRSKIFDVLKSPTARAILTSLYQRPGPASEIADRVDTSLQNVSYHLSRLLTVDLVTVIGTWYSSKGTEMKVYAPTNDLLVLIAGDVESKRNVAKIIDDDQADDPVKSKGQGPDVLPRGAVPAPLESTGVRR